ncbi:TolC family protein [Castellaniella hirudinis]|uniref:TolC family protein n=1 Tax=Castellaniella hirudinis TaxID=1144617 RepID=UPI0039C17653
MVRLLAVVLLSLGLSACAALDGMWPSGASDAAGREDAAAGNLSAHEPPAATPPDAAQPLGQPGGAADDRPAEAGGAGPAAGVLSAALDALDRRRAGQLTLAQAWPLALAHDAAWQAATSARLASGTFRAQGLAGLLPQVQAGFSRSRIDGLRRQPWLFDLMRESVLEYDSTNAYVQLQQPLFDLGRYNTWRWAQARADQGDADWQAARQDLAARLSDAWVAVLGAQDALVLRQALAESLEGQMKGQQALFRHDEGSVTDARQVQSRLEIARADAIQARAGLLVARQALQAMLGVPIGEGPDQRQPVAPQFAVAETPAAGAAPARPAAGVGMPPAVSPAGGHAEADADADADADVSAALTTIQAVALPPLRPARLVDWLDLARARNADIAAQRASLRVAQADVSRAASRHAPTLAFVASWAKADSENLSTLSQRTNTYVLGLQLNVPLFSGGYDTALTAQARDQARQASHTLDATLAQTLADVMRHYQAVTGGEQRIRALESAAESAALSLEAARKIQHYGLGSTLDTLKMQDRLFNVRAQLNQARLDYLRARIALLAAAGIPLDDIFLGHVFAS